MVRFSSPAGYRQVALLVLASALAACGGGGGGHHAEPPALRFAPTQLSYTGLEGDRARLTVYVYPQRQFDSAVYAQVDVNGELFTAPEIAQEGDYYTARFDLVDGIPAGVHTGNIVVRLCRDYACTAQHPGSPVMLPYSIALTSHTHLTPLSATEAPDWETYQGNVGHTGYVPMSLDPADFSLRWVWRPPVEQGKPGPVAIAGGRVYIPVSADFQPAELFALREADHGLEWEHDFGTIFALNPPAVSGGMVYAATSGHSDTAMWRFDAADGTLLSQTAFGSQWEHYLAPTVYGGSVYTNGGYYGGLNAFDAASGEDQWFATLHQYDQWTPAVDEGYAYAYVGQSCSGCNDAGLNVINRADGTLAFRINDPSYSWSGYSMGNAPMLGPSGAVITNNGMSGWNSSALVRFDVASQSIAWSKPGFYETQPAWRDGVVYVGADGSLVAVNDVDGSQLWAGSRPASADDLTPYRGNVIVTDTHAFASSGKRVYAFNLGTHQVVWSYPRPGALALSANGVLYVTRDDGAVGAINLR